MCFLSPLHRALPCIMAVGLAAMLAGAATAQQIDRSAFEQLFDEPVTTSATGKPQRASDVPADLEIITADDIRRSGADNLPDLLSFVAGLDVRRYGFAAADVSVRGYNETSNPRLLVLVDGQQVYLDDLGRTQWYTLPVALPEIRQIEVIRGPNTALFGFNAASGVINIITYDPLKDHPINSATVRVGTQGYSSLTAIGTGRIVDKGGIRVFIDGFNAREFAPVGVAADDLLFRQSPQRRAAGTSGKVQLAPGTELSFAGALVETRMWEATASPYFGTDYQRTNWSRVGLTSDTQAGLISVNAYRNELRYAYHGASESEDMHDTVYVLQLSDTMKLSPSHALRIGLDYRNNFATSSSVLAGKIGYQVVSGSVMWDWQITPHLSLTNAVRLDHFVLSQSGPLLPQSGLTAADFRGRTIDEPSFNSGLVWNATDADTFRLLMGRGLQLPSIYDLGLQDLQVYPSTGPNDPVQSFLAVGNPRANAAAVSNAELAWDRALPALGAHVRTAVFAQRTNNILTNPYEATPIYTNYPDGSQFALAKTANSGNSSAIGAEIGFRGKTPGGFRWNVSYSFISISDDLSINQGGIYSPQDFAHGTPTSVIVAGAGYTLGPWEMDAQARWQSRFRDFRVSGVDSTLTPVWISNAFTLNARVGYTMTPNFVVSLVAQQLNAARLTQAGAPPIERRFILSLAATL